MGRILRSSISAIAVATWWAGVPVAGTQQDGTGVIDHEVGLTVCASKDRPSAGESLPDCQMWRLPRATASLEASDGEAVWTGVADADGRVEARVPSDVELTLRVTTPLVERDVTFGPMIVQSGSVLSGSGNSEAAYEL